MLILYAPRELPDKPAIRRLETLGKLKVKRVRREKSMESSLVHAAADVDDGPDQMVVGTDE